MGPVKAQFPGRGCITAIMAALRRAGLPLAVGILASCSDPVASNAVPVFRLDDRAAWEIREVLVVEDHDPTQLYGVSGAKMLSDGGVVVGDGGAMEIRKFAANGEHEWSVGRRGEGPGEFMSLRVLRGCSNDSVFVVYDRLLGRVSEFGLDGMLRGEWRVLSSHGMPFEYSCGGGIRLIFHTPGSSPVRVGINRWRVTLQWADAASGTHVVRDDMPGPERVLTEESFHARHWGRQLVFAGVDEGIWVGAGDSFELDLVGWDGVLRRTLEWTGPSLEVTDAELRGFYGRLTYPFRDDEVQVREFDREMWPEWLDELPPTLPAYTRLLAVNGGELWVGLWAPNWLYRQPNDRGRTWMVFSDRGQEIRSVVIPGDMYLLDVVGTRVLVVVRDVLGVETLKGYEMVTE